MLLEAHWAVVLLYQDWVRTKCPLLLGKFRVLAVSLKNLANFLWHSSFLEGKIFLYYCLLEVNIRNCHVKSSA